MPDQTTPKGATSHAANAALLSAYDSPRKYHNAIDYDAFLGENIAHCQSILEVGSGSGELARSQAAIGKSVTLTDVYYGKQKPEFGAENAVAALGQELPFRGESFDATISAYTAQHVTNQGQFIREMVRVTRTAEETGDGSRGIIIVYPVFRSHELRRHIEASGNLDRCAAVGDADPPDDGLSLESRRLLGDSFLLIHKNPELTEDRLDELITVLTETKSLRPRVKSIGEIVVRVAQQLQGRLSHKAA